MTDQLVEILIKLACKADVSTEGRVPIYITIQISGVIVTGRIVSVRQFCLSNPVLNELLELWERTGAKVEPDTPPQFLHLQDVTFYTPGTPTIASLSMPFWRCKIEDISGFYPVLIGHRPIDSTPAT